jgi:hypothetical protein
MSPERNRQYNLLYLLFIVFFIAMLSFPAHMMAQDMYEKFPEYYPRNFDGKGKINRIVSEEVIIGDREFQLYADVSFNTPNLQRCSRYNFEKGDYVGYMLSDEGDIVSLWRLNEFYEERR